MTYPYPDPGAPQGLKTSLIVGLEIHVELATRSKMWTAAPNVAHPDYFDAPPNTLLSPVVVGLPGTLPVMNRAAVEMSVRVGLALNCAIADRTKWDRKSYYYPDLPKNYQISQYDQPLCHTGHLDLPSDAEQKKRIRILRAHLEEDAGKLLHELPGGGFSDGSLIDLNRAGTPLLEIVTEPDFTNADDVITFCNMLRDLCRHLGVTEGDMQRGHIRFEPNINVIIENAAGETFKTPIAEIKNLNSFRAVHGSITHEHHRQTQAWADTGIVMGAGAKSTRGWDDANEVTTLQREKEDAHDYRYFPDPDLVEVVIDQDWLTRARAQQPELPTEKRKRYLTDLELKPVDADTLLDQPRNTGYFDQVVSDGADPKRAAAFLLNTAMKRANEHSTTLDKLGITPAQTAGILALLQDNKVSSSAAEPLFNACCDPANQHQTPEQLAEKHGLLQVNDDSALDAWVHETINNPKLAKAVADVKAGKAKAIGALVGQVMKLSKGQANPQAVSAKVNEQLNA